MTKHEFMAKLTDELKKRNIEDAADVAEEYEQHFVFKLADGYSEEEIAAKLGDPTALAAQFDAAAQGGEKRSAVLTWLWLWLAALSVVGCIWFFAFVRQIFRDYGHFHRNALAPCRGAAALPALPLAPQLPAALRRRLRTVTLAALAVFAVCFVLAYIACSLCAGSLEFWHVWGWFGYA